MRELPDEFDPTVEMGLFADKFVVCSCRGFLTKNNDAKDLCESFIENGSHFYDVLDRYDKLTAYVLNREESTAGSTTKWCVPFLKAFGATDHAVHRCLSEKLEMMPEASRTMNYISGILPTYITTSVFDHGMMSVKEKLKAPLCEVACSEMCLDQTMFGRSESRRIRDMAKEICALKVPKTFYELGVPMELCQADIDIIATMDRILTEKLPETNAMALMETVVPMSAHKKAYRLLDIRRLMNIDLDCTMYIGSASTDFQPMDLVRDAGGLSIAFNGEDFAVRGSNIAILSEDTTVGAVFAETFCDKGLQAALDLANNWSRNYLKKADLPDRNLVDAMLRNNPRKLPEVFIVDDVDLDELAAKSDAYRRKKLGI